MGVVESTNWESTNRRHPASTNGVDSMFITVHLKAFKNYLITIVYCTNKAVILWPNSTVFLLASVHIMLLIMLLLLIYHAITIVIACMCVVAEILASVQQLLHIQNSDQEALERKIWPADLWNLWIIWINIDVNNIIGQSIHVHSMSSIICPTPV